jgi:hypothetical protein
VKRLIPSRRDLHHNGLLLSAPALLDCALTGTLSGNRVRFVSVTGGSFCSLVEALPYAHLCTHS